ncbi:16721_t:CDS:1, partial [Cetraspora pellucida]
EDQPMSNFTFKHLFAIRSILWNSESTTKSDKAIYAELFGLSKKVIDTAIRTNASQKLSDTLKSLLYDMQNKIDKNQPTDYNHITVINPSITRHKGQPPKQLKSSVEYSSYKDKQVLRNSTHVNISNNFENTNIVKSSNSGMITKGHMCGKYKKFGHYAKTCQKSV